MSINKVYPNAILLVIGLAVASVWFSYQAGALELEKTAFLVASTLAGGFIGCGMTFVRNFVKLHPASEKQQIMPIDLNVLICVICGVSVIGAALLRLDQAVYTDLVSEGLMTGFAGTLVAIIQAFAGQQDG